MTNLKYQNLTPCLLTNPIKLPVMNLYKLMFSHHAPKDSQIGILSLLLAESDEQVYEFFKTDPKFEDTNVYCPWQDAEEENEEFEIYDDKYEVIGKETLKEKMIRKRGQVCDEDYDYSDAYYGITLYGWELLKENVTTDYTELIELGIVKTV